MRNKNEQGSVMLESTYCILISIIVLIFLMSFGFFLYQKTIFTITANDIAEEIALTYKFRGVTDNKEITADDISGIGKYRYLLFLNRFDSANETKGMILSNVRLTKTSLAQSADELSVEVVTVSDDIGRKHYEVTIKQTYSFLLGDLLSIIGREDVQTFETTVYVDSYDVLNYINSIKSSKYLIDELKSHSATVELLNSAISLIKSVLD